MPGTDPGSVVVWRLGDTLLAVALGDVEEIVAVDPATGRARSRGELVDVVQPPGVSGSGRPPQAVVLRRPSGNRLALAADHVEGVLPSDAASSVDPPEWFRELKAAHLVGLVRVGDGRIAAALDVERLSGG